MSGSAPASSSSGGSAGPVDIDGLLPKDVVPLHYQLRLLPDYADWTFRGTVAITLRVDQPTDTVQLNAVGLDIDAARVQAAGAADESALQSSSIQLDAAAEVLTVRFDAALPAGETVLHLSYRGRIGADMKGLYRSQYWNQGVQHTILVTQFEATDARRCLPCFDEPARKATFALTLVLPPDMQALSNTPLVASTLLAEAECPERPDTKGWQCATFDTTPRMSSYLLAFAIGRFESVQTSTGTGTIVRLLTPLGKISEADFSLDFGRRALEFYEDYFAMPLPLPKMDLLCVPDCAITAMENFGLIVFGETALLVHPTDGSLVAKQYVARIVAHEIAHQWFGNITTMRWWDALWLNEGFASWMETFCAAALYPSLDLWDSYLINRYCYSLAADALHTSHPVEVPVAHPSEINELFDSITYNKGSVVVRQLQSYLGAEPFRLGLCAYLRKFAFQNATTKDLWASLSETTGRDVQKMMAQWTLQLGYPLVQVHQIDCSEDGSRVALQVTQRRFHITGPQDKDDTKWTLPLALTVAGSEQASEAVLFDAESGRVELSLPSTQGGASSSGPCAFKLNASQTYLYRVVYPLPHYALLRASLFSFSHLDRCGLQNDLFAAQRAGLVPFAVLADMVAALLEREDNYAVILDLSANLQDLGHVLKHSPEVYAAFTRWACALYRKALARFGWDAQSADEKPQVNVMRGKLVSLLTLWGDEETTREACRRFVAHEERSRALAASSAAAAPAPSGVLLAPDLREGVYFAVVSAGGFFGYETMNARFRAQTAAGGAREEQVRCLNALTATPNPELLARTLEWGLDHPDEVRAEDCSEFLASGALNPAAASSAVWWQFVRRRWSDISRTFEGAFCLPRIVSMAAQLESSDVFAKEFGAFFEEHRAPSAERAVLQTLERIRSNAQWREREEKNILAYCKEKMA